MPSGCEVRFREIQSARDELTHRGAWSRSRPQGRRAPDTLPPMLRESKGDISEGSGLVYIQVLAVCAETPALVPAMAKFKIFKDVVDILMNGLELG